MAENYYRLVCFVVNVCSEPLRELFLKLAKSEVGISSATLEAYLGTKRKAISDLYNKKKIRDDQYDSIYPSSGTADEKKWDVTLLVTLLMELFSLQALEITFIKEIREIRNKLQHLPNTADLSDTEYEDYWQRLETATLFIAKQVGGTSYEEEIADRINNAKIINFSYPFECLRVWYEEDKKQNAKKTEEMNKKMEEMNKKMEEMKRQLEETNCSSKETLSTLRKVTATKKGPSGSVVKRIKTVDTILSRLRDNYARTKQLELREDFSNPPEIGEICTHLREKHHVVVTGNGRYLEVALAAVSGMAYIPERCVEMSVSSVWRHIDPEEVDLVLCRDPFGSPCYDEQKAKSMADILSNMLLTTKEGVEAQRIDIVIVTDFSILNEFKHHYENELLDDVVNVFESTTENCPADLTLGCERHESSFSKATWPNNLKQMTELLLNNHTGCSELVDPEKLQLAKTKFNDHKMVVISGPRRSGKTSLAVKLIKSSYLESQSILLYSPNDVRYIDLKSPCIVIIEEFAGRYRYEKDDIFKWFKAFDFLYNATKAGKIKVIITCEKEKLEKSCQDIKDTGIIQHNLLRHQVDLTDSVVFVKEELTENIPTATVSDETISPVFEEFTTRMKTEDTEICSTSETTDVISTNSDHTAAESSDRQTVHGPTSVALRERHVQSRLQKNYQPSKRDGLSAFVRKEVIRIRIPNDKQECYISCICPLPTGQILLTDVNNKCVKKLSVNYVVYGVCSLSDGPQAVCYIGSNEAVVSLSKQLQIVEVTKMVLTRSFDVNRTYTGLCCHGDKLYAQGNEYISVYNAGSLRRGNLILGRSFHRTSFCLAVSDDGSKIYSLKQEGLYVLDGFGNNIYSFNYPHCSFYHCLCVDSTGRVILIDRVSREIIYHDLKQKPATVSESLRWNFACIKRNLVFNFNRLKSHLVCAGDTDYITVYLPG